MDTDLATLDHRDGGAVLRFERRIAHPPEKVWRLLTEPAELAHWFPAAVVVDGEPQVGTALRFRFEGAEHETTGEIIDLDPPRRFGFRWQDDVLRFELTPDGEGCLLTFTHDISDSTGGALAAARNAAGWDTCLAALTTRLEGGDPRATPPAGNDTMLARMEAYHEHFRLTYGEVRDTGDGHLIRFERDLVWRPAERIWAVVTGGAAVMVGDPAPPGDGDVPAGRVTAVDPPRVLEHEWLHQGRPAGVVRWEIITDPKAGHRVLLTQTVPYRLVDRTPAALATWHTHLELVFAAVVGDQRRPWPQARVEELTRWYANRQDSGPDAPSR